MALKRKLEKDLLPKISANGLSSENQHSNKMKRYNIPLESGTDFLTLSDIDTSSDQTLQILPLKNLEARQFPKIAAMDKFQKLVYCGPVNLPNDTHLVRELVPEQCSLKKIVLENSRIRHGDVTHILCKIPTMTEATFVSVISSKDDVCGCCMQDSGSKKIPLSMNSFTVSILHIENSKEVLCHVKAMPRLKILDISVLEDSDLDDCLELLRNTPYLKTLKLCCSGTQNQKKQAIYQHCLHTDTEFIPDVEGDTKNRTGSESWQSNSKKIKGTFSDSSQQSLRPHKSSKPFYDVVDVNEGYVCVYSSEPTNWPAYDYTCDHVEGLLNKYTDLLQRVGLQDETVNTMFSSHQTITIIGIGSAAKVLSRNSTELKQQENSKTSNLCFLINKPTVIVVYYRDLEILSNSCGSIHANKGLVAIIRAPNSRRIETCEAAILQMKSCKLRFAYATCETLFENIDDLLERYAFDGVRMIYQKLRVWQTAYDHLPEKTSKRTPGRLQSYEVDLNTHGMEINSNDSCMDINAHLALLEESNVHTISELMQSIRCMYKRSHLPEAEVPAGLPQKQFTNKDTTIQQLLTIDGVVGCGQTYDVLHVYVDEAIKLKKSNETKRKIMRIDNKAIIHYAPKNIALCSDVGTSIGDVQLGRSTLGAFAEKFHKNQPYEESRELCALTAKHAIHAYIMNGNANDISLKRNPSVYGTILPPVEDHFCDIAAITISKEDENKFNTLLKDRRGIARPSTLLALDWNAIEFVSNEVFLWGSHSATQPGIGTVSSMYHNDSNQHVPMILIEGRNPTGTRPFMAPGDSGAVVCTTNRSGKLFVLAMVMGELANDTYIAFGLRYALDELSQTHEMHHFQLLTRALNILPRGVTPVLPGAPDERILYRRSRRGISFVLPVAPRD